MNVKKTNITLILSFVFAFLALGIVVAAAFLLPSTFDSYVGIMQKSALFTDAKRTEALVILYAILVPALAADVSLIAVLRLVAKGEIFSKQAVRLLTVIPVCCFAETVLFGLLGMYFLISFAITFAALFLGFVLLVVRNVIAEAAAIKAENDFTV